MGAIFGLMLTGMLFYMIYGFLFDKADRDSTIKEFRDNPIMFIYSVSGAVCLVLFMWGVLLPALGEIQIDFGDRRIAIWQAAGLGVLGWLAIGFLLIMTKKR